MNWEAIGAIAELTGAIAVFGTLLYLAIQIKQVRSELHLTSLRESNKMGNEVMASLSESTDLAKVVAKARDGVDTLESWELVMLDSYFVRSLNAWELTLEQLHTGALQAPKESVYGALANSLGEPWQVDAWERNKRFFPPNFQIVIDRQLTDEESRGT